MSIKGDQNLLREICKQNIAYLKDENLVMKKSLFKKSYIKMANSVFKDIVKNKMILKFICRKVSRPL